MGVASEWQGELGVCHCPCRGPVEEYPPGTRRQPNTEKRPRMPCWAFAFLCSQGSDVYLFEHLLA